MRKFITLLILFYSTFLFGQYSAEDYLNTKGEVYFKFTINNLEDLKELSTIISIDNVSGNDIYAYANRFEYDRLMKYGYSIEVLRHPGDVGKVDMSNSSIELTKGWNTYPTYETYVQMMYGFEESNSLICKIIDAGNTVNGRKILFAKLSKNVNLNEAEPKIMLSSSMHGDETTGYVLMLRLIDSLLTSYNSNPRIKNLLDNSEIWINPLANPDGTYKGGNSTVNGATRSNANNIDINRNFPDPSDGQHPDGYAWQPETIIMMTLATNNYFTLSMNFHGGTEVANYPWDTWSRFHVDDAWFQYVSHEYADTCQKYAPSNYMNGYNDGITNGYDWYRITGGRQDYFTFFRKGREVTLEISDTKLLAPSLLPSHWEYNKRSFLNYIEQSLFGIKGIITDSLTGEPIKAKIEIIGHDLNIDSSFVYSDSETGFYTRLIAPGTYSLKITANEYFTKTISGVSVVNKNATIRNIQLAPTNPIPVELISFSANKSNLGILLDWTTATEVNNKGFEVFRRNVNNEWQNIAFIPGQGTTSEIQKYQYMDKLSQNGNYQYRLKQLDYDGTFQFSSIASVEFANNYSYNLFSNYPNPFNPSTTISFSLPVDAKVSIDIYNLIGQKIANLTNQVFTSGKHDIKFDAKNLSAGIYIYKIEAQGFDKSFFSTSNKMILMK